VTRADFERALDDVKPAFGVKEDELSRCFMNGIISTGPSFDTVYVTLQRFVHQVCNAIESDAFFSLAAFMSLPVVKPVLSLTRSAPYCH
jgi:vesicle-fusing ATPase